MELTHQQLKTIETDHPLVVVISCAGAGKTTLIAERVKRLIRDGVPPESIAAITYTNAAAFTLSSKIGCKIGTCTTLHGMCLQIIQDQGCRIGFERSNLVVLDEEQSEEFIDRQCEIMRFRGSREKLRRVMLNGMPTGERFTDEERMAGRIYHTLKRTNTLIFDAILVYAFELLKVMDGKCAFDHLLVDEMQDCSGLDANIYSLLPVTHRFYVGDPRQSLFEFRAGDPQHLIDLSNHPDTETRYLSQNFRSSQPVVDAANKLALRMPDPFYPPMTPAYPNFIRGWVGCLCFETAEEEVAAIAKALTCGDLDSTWAVLVRTNDLADWYRERLTGFGGRLTVSTFHKAKSTEYTGCFIPAMEEGLIPLASDSEEDARRMLYVAVTRARNFVALSWARYRQKPWAFKPEPCTPSRFIRELGL